jgi:hypothetical protein
MAATIYKLFSQAGKVMPIAESNNLSVFLTKGAGKQISVCESNNISLREAN